MSRRKQANPQCVHLDAHLTSVEHADYNINFSSPSTDVHVCERCCAEFFNLPELQDHQRSCCKNPLVLIVNENGRPASPCPSFVLNSPPNSAEEHLSDSISIEDTAELHVSSKEIILDGNKESVLMTEGNGCENTLLSPTNNEIDLKNSKTSSVTLTSGFSSVLPQVASPPELGKVSSTSSNVFIENLETTKVAVAQFSQELCVNTEVSSSTPAGSSMTIPDLIEQLMDLQQQQVQQLKLIEQIRHQIFILSAQNTDTSAPSSTCQGKTEFSQTSPLIALSSHLSQQLAAAAGLVQSLTSQSASLSSVKELKHSVLSSSNDSPTCMSSISQMTDTDASKALTSKLGICPSKMNSTYDNSHPSFSNGISILNSSAVTLESASDSTNKLCLPHTHAGNHIFANMSPSIGAIVEDLNALTALAQHRKGKQHNVTSNEPKRPFDDGLFKHKCKFCAKVFGSDSALQIHLRSHTGERPYKCNICGNRFSTRGNLKVHFQRHKEKYPNIQMNPYPVPEHLDNVPTSTGIPYGMSMLPDKSVSNWLDSKPSVTNLPGLLLPSSLPSLPNIIKREEQVISITTPAGPVVNDLSEFETFEKRSNTKEQFSSDPFLTLSEKYEEGKNNLSFSAGLNSSESSDDNTSTENTSMHTDLENPTPNGKLKRKFPFGFENLPDSMEASETTKLQQLVENIDKKCRDPNECRVCHRVLSCQSALKMHYRTHTGERPYKCRMCGRAFTTKGNLKTHYSIHRAIPPIKMQHSCPICQEKFTNAMVLQQHIRMHMVGKIPIVSLAESHQESMEHDAMKVLDDQGNPSDGDMETDALSDSKDTASPLYSLCSSPIPSQTLKIADSKSHAPVLQQNDLIDRLESGLLGGSFLALRSSSDDYQVSHSPVSPELCETTSPWDSLAQRTSTLESYGSVTTEKQQNTSPEEQTGPDFLQPDFTGSNSFDSTSVDITKDGVTMMLSSRDRGTSKTNACDTCNKTFACQSALDIHYRSHTKERPFLCSACNRGFSTKGNLKQHMLTHQMRDLPSRLFEPSPKSPPYPSVGHLMSSNIKMEVNSILNKDGRNSLLEIVRSIPSSLPALAAPPVPPRRTPKQHFCHSCGKTFSSSSALQIHERTHTGEKPFACTICGRAFTTKGNLKVHMGTHMWNSVPARRGRRLSVDGPLTFLKSSSVKVQENISKDIIGIASNGESLSLWNQCDTTARTNGMALKTNEISVIQNGGIPQLSLSVGHGENSPIGGLTVGLEKLHNVELKRVLPWLERLSENGTSCHLTQLMEESKMD